jgi:hypothetical protein
MLSPKSKPNAARFMLAALLLILIVAISLTGLLTGTPPGASGPPQAPQIGGPLMAQNAVTPSAAQATEIARQAEAAPVTKLANGGEVRTSVKKALSPAVRTLPTRRMATYQASTARAPSAGWQFASVSGGQGAPDRVRPAGHAANDSQF